MWRIAVIVFVMLVAGVAYSDAPPQTPTKAEQKQQAHPQQKQQRTSQDKRGTESSPLFIKVVQPLPVEPRPTEHVEQPSDYASPEWWLVWVTLILAGITAILACYTAKLWGATKTLAKDAKVSAERQAGEMQKSLKIAEEAAKAAQKSADATMKSVQHAVVTERAYVKMSHTEQGLWIFQNPTVRMCEVTMKVGNGGRTPATVTDVRLNAHLSEWGEPLPPTPNYGQPYPHGAPFLVPEDFFFWGLRTFPLGLIDSPNPETGAIRLCLFGYVDYIDAFDQRHRAGYAREYRAVQGNNLFFIGEPGYNYDRLRQPGEGNDWNEPPPS